MEVELSRRNTEIGFFLAATTSGITEVVATIFSNNEAEILRYLAVWSISHNNVCFDGEALEI